MLEKQKDEETENHRLKEDEEKEKEEEIDEISENLLYKKQTYFNTRRG